VVTEIETEKNLSDDAENNTGVASAGSNYDEQNDRPIYSFTRCFAHYNAHVTAAVQR